MDMKINKNYAVYQKVINSGKRIEAEKETTLPTQGAGKLRGDALCISSEGVKKSEASAFASVLNRTLEEGTSPERLSALKQQIQEGSYQISAEVIAKRLMNGL